MGKLPISMAMFNGYVELEGTKCRSMPGVSSSLSPRRSNQVEKALRHPWVIRVHSVNPVNLLPMNSPARRVQKRAAAECPRGWVGKIYAEVGEVLRYISLTISNWGQNSPRDLKKSQDVSRYPSTSLSMVPYALCGIQAAKRPEAHRSSLDEHAMKPGSASRVGNLLQVQVQAVWADQKASFYFRKSHE